MNVIICGSRYFTDYERMCSTMDTLLKDVNIAKIITGGANGADEMGKAYAISRGYKNEEMPADWGKHGKAAGPIRNTAMAQQAHATIAFWDGRSRGTRDMIRKAQNHKHCYVHIIHTEE